MSVIKNYKKIIYILFGILSLPVIGVLIKVIFIYGQYVGTIARKIAELGIC